MLANKELTQTMKFNLSLPRVRLSALTIWGNFPRFLLFLWGWYYAFLSKFYCSAHSQPFSPPRNKDMEISCENIGQTILGTRNYHFFKPASLNVVAYKRTAENDAFAGFTYYIRLPMEKIQIGGLQPSHDLTSNEPIVVMQSLYNINLTNWNRSWADLGDKI